MSITANEEDAQRGRVRIPTEPYGMSSFEIQDNSVDVSPSFFLKNKILKFPVEILYDIFYTLLNEELESK